MAKLKIEIEVAEDEACAFLMALSDLCEDHGLEYLCVPPAEPDVIDLPPVDDSEARGYLQDLCGRVYEDVFGEVEADDSELTQLMPGDVLSLPGTDVVYQVFSIDATGRVILDELEELTDNEENEDA